MPLLPQHTLILIFNTFALWVPPKNLQKLPLQPLPPPPPLQSTSMPKWQCSPTTGCPGPPSTRRASSRAKPKGRRSPSARDSATAGTMPCRSSSLLRGRMPKWQSPNPGRSMPRGSTRTFSPSGSPIPHRTNWKTWPILPGDSENASNRQSRGREISLPIFVCKF